MLLGCIADDFTGATDLASALVRGGLRTVQVIGVPSASNDVPLAGVDAVVVALKSRTAAVATAVEQSLAALDWLTRLGCRQYYFKYCSTFDSTPRGNIGPVADALMGRLGLDFTVACPSLPANGRTVYNGYLFLDGQLLNESSMRHHPLTPMLDAQVGRLLQRQTTSPVGLVTKDVVDRGWQQVRADLDRLRAEGCRIAVMDAINTADLVTVGQACADLVLVTGGSGLAVGLTRGLRETEGLQLGEEAAALPGGHRGASAVVAGSASAATRAQIETMLARHPGYPVEPARLAAGEDVAAEALEWASAHLATGPVLVYAAATGLDESTAAPPSLAVRIEETLAAVARGLVEMGVGRLVVAGGETSGAVVSALGATALLIGGEISPGVPWTVAVDTPRPVALALKSGGFGAADFFLRALDTAP